MASFEVFAGVQPWEEQQSPTSPVHELPSPVETALARTRSTSVGSPPSSPIALQRQLSGDPESPPPAWKRRPSVSTQNSLASARSRDSSQFSTSPPHQNQGLHHVQSLPPSRRHPSLTMTRAAVAQRAVREDGIVIPPRAGVRPGPPGAYRRRAPTTGSNRSSVISGDLNSEELWTLEDSTPDMSNPSRPSAERPLDTIRRMSQTYDNPMYSTEIPTEIIWPTAPADFDYLPPPKTKSMTNMAGNRKSRVLRKSSSRATSMNGDAMLSAYPHKDKDAMSSAHSSTTDLSIPVNRSHTSLSSRPSSLGYGFDLLSTLAPRDGGYAIAAQIGNPTFSPVSSVHSDMDRRSMGGSPNPQYRNSRTGPPARSSGMRWTGEAGDEFSAPPGRMSSVTTMSSLSSQTSDYEPAPPAAVTAAPAAPSPLSQLTTAAEFDRSASPMPASPATLPNANGHEAVAVAAVAVATAGAATAAVAAKPKSKKELKAEAKAAAKEAKLKAERDAKEAKLQAERDAREKAEAEREASRKAAADKLKAKADAERKAKEDKLRLKAEKAAKEREAKEAKEAAKSAKATKAAMAMKAKAAPASKQSSPAPQPLPKSPPKASPTAQAVAAPAPQAQANPPMAGVASTKPSIQIPQRVSSAAYVPPPSAPTPPPQQQQRASLPVPMPMPVPQQQQVQHAPNAYPPGAAPAVPQHQHKGPSSRPMVAQPQPQRASAPIPQGAAAAAVAPPPQQHQQQQPRTPTPQRNTPTPQHQASKQELDPRPTNNRTPSSTGSQLSVTKASTSSSSTTPTRATDGPALRASKSKSGLFTSLKKRFSMAALDQVDTPAASARPNSIAVPQAPAARTEKPQVAPVPTVETPPAPPAKSNRPYGQVPRPVVVPPRGSSLAPRSLSPIPADNQNDVYGRQPSLSNPSSEVVTPTTSMATNSSPSFFEAQPPALPFRDRSDSNASGSQGTATSFIQTDDHALPESDNGHVQNIVPLPYSQHMPTVTLCTPEDAMTPQLTRSEVVPGVAAH